ncbi:hypothetical protein SAMN06272759_11436 [Novosphingobium sp. B1]|jgi:hypothetical protein|nr:hypothetical protein SAMN06272759_11436 [Novosphingobium sp. B1]
MESKVVRGMIIAAPPAILMWLALAEVVHLVG